jgi:hypothetical protein
MERLLSGHTATILHRQYLPHSDAEGSYASGGGLIKMNYIKL